MGSCVYTPMVNTPSGEKESILFKDIKNLVKNNDTAWLLYGKTLTDKFKTLIGDKLEKDAYGEPTFRSIWEQTDLLDDYISNKETEALHNANISIGHIDSKGNIISKKDTYENRISIGRKVVEYNDNRLSTGVLAKDQYVGTIEQDVKDGITITPKVVKTTKALEDTANRTKAGIKLHDYLSEYLLKYGVRVEDMEETLELMEGVSGYIDFSEVQNFSTGLVSLIKLAKGEKGIRALPEEFSHFIIAATIDNPIITRLVNNIADNNLAPIILGDKYDIVVEQQKGNKDNNSIVKEAAGKLLADAIQGKFYDSGASKSLVDRGNATVKDLFGNMSENNLEECIQEALNDSNLIAEQILTDSLIGSTSVNNITDRGLYYDADVAINQQKAYVSRKRNILEKAIKIEKAKYDLIKKAYKDKSMVSGYQNVILEMEGNLLMKQEMRGLYSFVNTELKFLQDAYTDLVNIKNGDYKGNKDAALKRVRNQIRSLVSLVQEIKFDMENDMTNKDSEYRKEFLDYERDFQTIFDNLGRLLTTITVMYDELASASYIEFLKKYLGDSVITAWQNGHKKKFKPQEIFDINVEDIGFGDLWIDAARDSKSPIVQAYDTAIKEAREKARIKTIAAEKMLGAAKIELEQSGIKDTDWIYEVDENGKRTGNFVTKYRFLDIKRDKNEVYKRVLEKHKGIKTAAYLKELKEELRKIEDPTTRKINPKYLNPAYASIMSNKYKKKFYQTVMHFKETLDTDAGLLFRGYTSIEHAPRIRQDLLQRAKQKGFAGAGKVFWESLQDMVIRRSDDTAFGMMGKSALKDFEDREVNLLPLYYLKFADKEDMNDISTDTVSTMVAYANMIYNYMELGEIVDSLENGIDVMTDNLNVAMTNNGKGLMYKFKFLDEEITNDLKKKFGDSNIAKRLDYLMKMRVYGKETKDQGTFGNTKIDKAKAGGVLMGATAFTGLALNFLAGLANATLNVVNMNTEAFGRRFFKPKDLWKADKTFLKLCPQMFMECENRVKTNKLSLINELFDVVQDFDKNVKDLKFRRKTVLGRIFNGGSLYVFTTMGDNWAYFRTALSILNATKLINSETGEETSLLDALQVNYIDPNNKALGATLDLDDKYKKPDGSEFKVEDISKLKDLIAYVNQQMFGIYNSADKNAMQYGVLGRMAIMYRKYMRPNFMRRFMSEREITGLGITDEGYYRTLWKFTGDLIKDLKSFEFHALANFRNLDKWKQANIRKSLWELSIFTIVAVLANLSFKDPEKDDPWLAKIAMYQAKRLYMEMGAFIPPFALQEGTQLMRQPSATISTADDIVRLLKLALPSTYTHIMQSGRFEGRSEAYKIFMESPFGLQTRSIYRALHPEVTYSFFSWKN